MDQNDLIKYTVKVNNGSGCLFQPSNPEYSYVLTARHVIENSDTITIIRQNLINGIVSNEELTITGDPFYHENTNKDAAIIKIEPIPNLNELLIDIKETFDDSQYLLCGFPKSRENENFTFRTNKLALLNYKEHGYIEAELKNTANFDEIVGQSGGGIIRLEDSCLLLNGIQKKMTSKDEVEQLGRIDFMPIRFFQEIIDNHPEELAHLYPPYISSFDRLLNEIFNLDNLTIKRNLIQNELKVIARDLCNDFSPEKILDIYGDTFLCANMEPGIITHKSLWIAFLELLTYNQLHVLKKLSLKDLQELHKKRKLLIVDSNAWTKHIEDIYRSDLSEIEKGGSVVICATDEKSPSKVELDSDELPILDISVPMSEMNISNTITNPFSDLRLVNIFKFQRQIMENILAYKNAQTVNVRDILKNETKDVL